MAGYHSTTIPKGKLGEISKVTEEYQELIDACVQLNPVMALQEMSDLIGAIEALAANYNITLDELIKMHRVTQQVFKTGHRI